MDLSDDATRHARDLLLRLRERCTLDRFTCFPRRTLEQMARGPMDVIVLGTHGKEFPAQLAHVARVAEAQGSRVRAVVADVGEDAAAHAFAATSHVPVIGLEQFFGEAGRHADCLVVDRTCTWYPGVRYKVRLKQAGLHVLRFEQFVHAAAKAPEDAAYRAHSDLMLARFDEFLAVERYWDDALSLQTYYYALAAFIGMNHEYFAFHCGDYAQRYFAPDCGLAFGESTVYADCGSNDGGEVLIFAALANHRFKAAHAFEPERSNFRVLCDTLARYQAVHGPRPVYPHECGVYDRNAFLPFQGSGTAVSIDESGAAAGSGAGIHVSRLDDVLDELGHLRLEIEGAELAALRGARGLILRDRPSMTISAYHRPEDFLELPRFVEETGLGYRMRLRHQSLEAGVLCIYAA